MILERGRGTRIGQFKFSPHPWLRPEPEEGRVMLPTLVLCGSRIVSFFPARWVGGREALGSSQLALTQQEQSGVALYIAHATTAWCTFDLFHFECFLSYCVQQAVIEISHDILLQKAIFPKHINIQRRTFKYLENTVFCLEDRKADPLLLT